MKGETVSRWTAIIASLALLLLSGAYRSWSQEQRVGQFDRNSDVGMPKIPGSASYNAMSQEYRITGSGANMWGERDEFHFVWKRLQGDFILQTRVEFVGKGVDPHRKIGLIVRSTLDGDSPYADAVLHGDGLASLQFRRSRGAITEQVRSEVANPDMLQLERRGSTYTFSAARFGEPFAPVQISELKLGDDVYAGLFVCSHNPDVIEQAVFRNVRIVRTAKEDFVPYRDYIGSHLEIVDVRNGNRQIVHSSSEPFEAPNWTSDGTALVYNTSGRSENRGRLYRFDLATRRATLINTGFATRNNNDHVLSFDGTKIGLSHHSADDGGRPAIFVVPIQGGTPKRVTPLTPSYLHGWSPDGKYLVYTGGRNDEYDIYKIPVNGGEEIRLTDFKGLDDGPEYTPDGKYIYFNSTRSGKMQIWRMEPDGRNPEQISNDGYNNWFPHISPDGKWVAFLSYSSDVNPSDHPYYRQVYLRVMPVEGGAAKVIAYVYGGQGSLNVPSWSPDGTMLAFVSNSRME